MRTATALVLSICVLQVLGAFMVDTAAPRHDERYIAVFHSESTEDERFEIIDRLNQKRKRNEQAEVTHHSLEDFNAISGHFTQEDLDELLKEEKIHYIQPNLRYKLSQACTKTKGVWHLERINNHTRPRRFTGAYQWSQGAASVDVYVMDSGIEIRHPEFEGRATWGVNTSDRIDRDCNGHGTHVAGTVGSKTYGVAKKVNLIAVKSMNCEGAGDSFGMMQAHQWIAKQYKAKRRPAVVNMSLGSPFDRAHNDIIREAVRLGLVYVVAAGNEAQDACLTSPASAPEAITVGATNMRDEFTDFSNYGRCVHILAPGEEITSTWPGLTTKTISGTSMACPHVAGVAAQLLAAAPTSTPVQIKAKLLQVSKEQNILGVPYRTPKNFLYSAC